MLTYDPATRLVEARIGDVTRLLDLADLAIIGAVVVQLSASGRTVTSQELAMLVLDSSGDGSGPRHLRSRD